MIDADITIMIRPNTETVMSSSGSVMPASRRAAGRGIMRTRFVSDIALHHLDRASDLRVGGGDLDGDLLDEIVRHRRPGCARAEIAVGIVDPGVRLGAVVLLLNGGPVGGPAFGLDGGLCVHRV